MSALVAEPMPDAQKKDTYRRAEARQQDQGGDRRTHLRTGTVLSRIEDATYKILRKHDKSA
jgi:hypothetical protein